MRSRIRGFVFSSFSVRGPRTDNVDAPLVPVCLEFALKMRPISPNFGWIRPCPYRKVGVIALIYLNDFCFFFVAVVFASSLLWKFTLSLGTL